MNLSKIWLKSVLLWIAIFSFVSCNNENQSENTSNNKLKEKLDTINTSEIKKDTVLKNKIPVNNEINISNVKFGPAPDMFRQSMNDIFDAYMSITYSLCFGDPNGVKVGTAVFKDMQSRIDPSVISGEMKTFWEKYSNNLSTVIANIEASNDLNTQRKYYARLSELMTIAIKNYRIKGKEVRKYNCPQALDGSGAYWYFEISPAYTLMNPYLGQGSKDCLNPVETLNYSK